jgi:hypothetical protein
MENGKERNEIRFLDIHYLILISGIRIAFYSNPVVNPHSIFEDRMVTILRNLRRVSCRHPPILEGCLRELCDVVAVLR